jgi:amidase
MTIVRYTPGRQEWAHHFGGEPAKISIAPGDLVQVGTEDCFGGLVRSPADLPSQVVPFEALNPVAGPFHVETAEAGDVLAVHFVDIVPSRETAISSLFPHFGALSPTHETAMLADPLPEKVWFYQLDVERWTATFTALAGDFSRELPLDPMHGTVGVAPPAGESRLVVVPSTYGGNLDTPEMRAGTTLYLPVNVDGAMLALGDGHARQGEGEVTGTGLECAMHTVFTVEVIKEAAPAWPRLENDELIMSTGSIRPLEDAFRIAMKDLVEWVADLLRIDRFDAYQLVSQVATAPVANVCDPNYTVVSRFPKSLLGPDSSAYGGVHARLRAIGDDYLRSNPRIW